MGSSLRCCTKSKNDVEVIEDDINTTVLIQTFNKQIPLYQSTIKLLHVWTIIFLIEAHKFALFTLPNRRY